MDERAVTGEDLFLSLLVRTDGIMLVDSCELCIDLYYDFVENLFACALVCVWAKVWGPLRVKQFVWAFPCAMMPFCSCY